MKLVATVAVLALAGFGGLSSLPDDTATASRSDGPASTTTPHELLLPPSTSAEQWSQPVLGSPLADRVAQVRAEEAAQAEAERIASATISARKAEAVQKERDAKAAKKRADDAANQQLVARRAADARNLGIAAPAAEPAPKAVEEVVESDSGMNSSMDRLAKCESGSNPEIVSRNGRFYGAFQFMVSTWHSLGYDGVPTDYSYEVQREAAIKLQDRSGWGQWPTCSRMLGLR